MFQQYNYINEDALDTVFARDENGDRDVLGRLKSLEDNLTCELAVYSPESAVSQVVNYIKEVLMLVSSETGYDFYVFYKNFKESNRAFQLDVNKPLHEIIKDGTEYFFIENITNLKNERAQERAKLAKDEVITTTTYLKCEFDTRNMEVHVYPQTIDLDDSEDTK
jgi:hypothetical protein